MNEKFDTNDLVRGAAARQAAVIGPRLRALRLARDMTQAQLASLADVEQANLSRIETGRSNPSGTTISKLLRAMGRSLSDLAEDSTPASAGQAGTPRATPRRTDRDVTVTLVVRTRRGEHEAVLTVWDERRGWFALPKASRRGARGGGDAQGAEDWCEAAARAAAKWLGITCTLEEGQPAYLREIRTLSEAGLTFRPGRHTGAVLRRSCDDVAGSPSGDYDQPRVVDTRRGEGREHLSSGGLGGSDGSSPDAGGTRHHVRVFVLSLPGDEPVPLRAGAVGEWLRPSEFVNKHRLLIAPMARWLMQAVLEAAGSSGKQGLASLR